MPDELLGYTMRVYLGCDMGAGNKWARCLVCGLPTEKGYAHLGKYDCWDEGNYHGVPMIDPVRFDVPSEIDVAWHAYFGDNTP